MLRGGVLTAPLKHQSPVPKSGAEQEREVAIVKVEVLTQDIAEGERRSRTGCSIALAVKRATGEPYVSVNTKFISVAASLCDGSNIGGLKFTDYPTPPEVERFIRTFDAHETGAPFGFLLADPSDALAQRA